MEELVNLVVKKTGLPKETAQTVDLCLNPVAESV